MGWFTGKKRLRQLEEENAQLRQDKARLESRVAELQAENARLMNQLAAARKHSGNSSTKPARPSHSPRESSSNCCPNKLASTPMRPDTKRMASVTGSGVSGPPVLSFSRSTPPVAPRS